MSSISPDLIKALEVNGQMNFMSSLAENMSPIAIANNESVAETTDRLLRGMPIDASIKKALGHLDI